MTYRTTATRWKAWDYRDTSWIGTNITGFSIEALDGGIGKIDDATMDTGRSYLVVDTGPWIFGKKVMLPAGVVSNIDHAARKVFVDRTKDQIMSAPQFDDSLRDDMTYRDTLGTYYGEGGAGWREPVY
jgi:hypothetical protein